MKKKGVAVSLSALLLSGSIAPTILAAEVSKSPVETIAANNKNDNNEENERIVERVHVDSLSLEDAIRYGTNSSYSLLELDYALEQLDIQEDQMDDQLDVAETSLESALKRKAELEKEIEATSSDTMTIDLSDQVNDLVTSLNQLNIDISEIEEPTPIDNTNSLSSTITYLRDFLTNTQKYVEEYEKYQQNQLLRDQLELVKTNIESLVNTVATLENSLDSLDLQNSSLFNDRIKARESMELSISSSYVQLVMLQEQIDYLKEVLSTQQTQADAQKVRNELGLLSDRDYEKETRSIKDMETQIADLEKKLKTDKATFALTIGITYDEDYTIETPELGELSLIEQTTPTADLVKNSYDMVNARNDLLRAEDRLDDIEDIEGRTKHDEDLAEVEVDIAKLKLESLEVSLEKAVNNLYNQVQQQYSALQSAKKKLDEAKVDNGDLQVYYDLGLLSKNEYDAGNVSVKEAEFNYNNAKYQYYLVTKQIELMEARVILTN